MKNIVLFLLSLSLIHPLNGNWSPAMQISNEPASTNNNGTPLLMDANSVATIGYLGGQQGEAQNLYSSTLLPSQSVWSTPQLVYGNNIPNTFPTQSIMSEDNYGNQLTGFGLFYPNQRPYQVISLNACRRPANTNTWGSPFSQPLNGVPQSSGFAADGLGNLAVFFGVSQTTGGSGYGSPFTITLGNIVANASQWSPQQMFGIDYSQTSALAAAAYNGTATLAWKLNSETLNNLQVQTGRFDFSTQIMTPLNNLPLPPSATDVFEIGLAADPKGDAILIFTAQLGENAPVQLYSSTLLAGQNSWSNPLLISHAGNYVNNGSIACDASGNATILWQEQTQTYLGYVYAATLPLGGTTPTFVTLLSSDENGVDASSPVAMDSAGNAAAIWRIASGNNPVVPLVVIASKPVGQNWSTPIPLSGNGSEPLVALSDRGAGVATWVDNDTNFLMGSRNLALFTLPPPSNFVGRLTPAGNKIKMSWNPSPASDIAYYEIYKGNRLIATIPGSGPYNYLQDTSKYGKRDYKIRAVAVNREYSIFIPMHIVKKCWQY